MSIVLYPYKKGLASTRLLKEQGCKVRYGTSTVRGGVAMAWGMRTMPSWGDQVAWINPPDSINVVSDKLRWALWCTANDTAVGHPPSSTLEYTVGPTEAREWASVQGQKVVCRTVLDGHSGEGIVIARNPDQVIDAPLYSKYFAKQREYRVVFSPLLGVVYVASKRLRPDTDLDRDSLLVRTMSNGFVYQLEHEPLPTEVQNCVSSVATMLRSTTGLKLLAYDVAYNTETDQARVIEANSAWGMNEHTATLTCEAMAQIGDRL